MLCAHSLAKALNILAESRQYMKIKKETPKIKLDFKLSEEFLDLRSMRDNLIIKKLEENIKLRELSVEKRFKRQLEQL